MNDAPARLRVEGLVKRYAAPVLQDVALECRAGEVLALIGANGAGKSTLAGIMAGVVRPDGGRMELDGVPYEPHRKAEAEAAGVHLVPQELNLIETLTVAENLFLDRLPSRLGVVRRAELARAAREALARMDLGDLHPDAPVAALGVGTRQQVAIAAALARRCRVLILDEPTAALTDPQIERLFEHLARLRSEGVSILYISHRMDEIRRIADRTIVLRDGRVVATRHAATLTTDEAVRLMAGGEIGLTAATPRHPGEVRLRVRGLRREPAVRGVDLDARAGEILGIAGLIGSGRTELLRAIFGADAATDGTVQIADAPPRRFRSPKEAVAAGLAMVPEDRATEGLLLPRSVIENLSLASLGRFRRTTGRLDANAERSAAAEVARRLDVRCRGLDQPVVELSGGNQQKTLVGRWLMRNAEIYLLDEPTRGVDIAAKAAIRAALDALARAGRVCVVVSSELEELMAMCDRIAVMWNGRVVQVFERGQWSLERLLRAAFGHPDAPPAAAETAS